VSPALAPSRRAQLRAHTAARHEQLHHQSPFADINRGTFGARDVALMERLHAQCWSAYAHPANAAAFRTAVGLSPEALFSLQPEATTACRRVSPAAACGAAYVYLGSKFGGTVLSRRLDAAGFHDAALAMRQSDADKSTWRVLLASLDDLDADGFRAACGEADYAFDAFRLPQATLSD
jgi:hypothetical protein